jgi:hypothetical protein
MSLFRQGAVSSPRQTTTARRWHDGTVIRHVDYGPLLGTPSADDVARFRAVRQNDPAYRVWNGAIAGAVGLGCAGLVMVMLFGGFAVVPISLGIQGQSALGIGFGVLMTVVTAGIVALTIWGIRASLLHAAKRWPRWVKLDAFARANGMVFSPRDPDPAYPGAIFGVGSSRSTTEHLRSADDRFLDYGNYQFVTSNGKSSTTHTWGFLALHLDRTLPHMVLDASGNNGLFGTSTLPASFDRSQVLSLEGNFDDFFTLYCPKAYERDALYVFTPDLMALLIDNASPFDVEIVDRWMFVYSRLAFDLEQPGLHQRMLQIVDTIGSKTLTQTDRYVDERIGQFPPNVVAPQGQRLRRRFPVWAIVLVAVIGASFVLPMLIAMIAFLAAALGGAPGAP